MDKIFLNQMEFYGYHGVFKEEAVLGQRFIVDVELEVPLQKAGETDDLNESVNYGEVYSVVRTVVEDERYLLVERIAVRITEELFNQFSLIDAIQVKVYKPDPPIKGHYKSVGVQIYRRRSE